jgi:hypothetical protein
MAQKKTAVALAKFLSKSEVGALVDEPQMRAVGTEITNNVLRKIGVEVGPDAVLAACDMAGVSQEGYGQIYKTVKGRVKLVDPQLRVNFMPKPYKVGQMIQAFVIFYKGFFPVYVVKVFMDLSLTILEAPILLKHVSLLRRELNSNLPEFIGNYQHIEGRYTALAPKKKQVGSKVAPILDLKLDDKNSLFIDLEVVQRSMVKFYDITEEGTWIWIDGNCLGSIGCAMDSQNFRLGVGSISHVLYLLLLHVPELYGKPLIFVLKLDEAEILHGKKFEKVSLTLLNWALDP